MALIAMAIFDTEENRRSKLTQRTLLSLARTVNWDKHRLILVDNGSCAETRKYLDDLCSDDGPTSLGSFQVIRNAENRGTALAINQAWQRRRPSENAIKMDNDCIIEEPGWLDRLEECVARDPKIGIIGLKRKDLAESPFNPPGSWSHSTLKMLQHEPGERWLIVEEVQHVLGTCQLYSSALLDKIGYLVQFGKYGLDDGLAAARCHAAGFYNCFYPHVGIDHIDPGTTPFQKWKEAEAGKRMNRFIEFREKIYAGEVGYYFGPNVDLDLLEV